MLDAQTLKHTNTNSIFSRNGACFDCGLLNHNWMIFRAAHFYWRRSTIAE